MGYSMVVSGILAWLQEWSVVISGLGSIALTLGLVILYWKQHGLLRRELNREVRHQHTEVLRERIRAWHGDLEEIGQSDEPILQDPTHLPNVQGASVKSAPGVIQVVGEETEFRVVPAVIEDDLYLQDLLNNHAPELKALKETIEDKYRYFENTREKFLQGYTAGERIENEEYLIEPREHLANWAFEQAVLLNREYHRDRDKERLKSIAESALDDASYFNQDENIWFYSPEPKDGAPATYTVTPITHGVEDYREIEDEVIEELKALHIERIDEIEDLDVYHHAIEAAEILDSLVFEIEELRAKLVEYEGHPLYQGNCQYLKDASVSNSITGRLVARARKLW